MGYELPEIINPPTITFCIEVPDEPFHLRAFWGALWELARPYNWDNDEDHTALEVGALWKELWFKNHSQWRERECMTCADELCDKLDEIIALMRGGMTLRFNDVVPDFAGGSCAPAYFDHDTDEVDSEVLIQRQKALCITVERYIKALLLGALIDMGAPQFVVDFLESSLLSDIPTPLKKLTVHYPLGFIGLAVFYAIVSATLSYEALVCIMVAALEGDKNNTFVNFKNAMPLTSEGLDDLLVPLLGLIRASNQNKENYTQFNVALNDANNEDLDAYECPCELPPVDTCEFPIVLTADFKGAAGVNIVLEEVEAGVWHITNNVPYETSPNIRYLGAYRDEHNQCLKLVTMPDGYPAPQGIVEHDLHGCCGTANSVSVGGYPTFGILDVSWTTSDPVDTYIKVACVPPDECE